MLHKFGDDINNLILSFLIKEYKKEDNEYTYTGFEMFMSSNDINFPSLELTNDITFLRLTSKYLNNLIDKYIDNDKRSHTNKVVYASTHGHVNVLEWCAQNDTLYGGEFSSCKWAINNASDNGHVNVLEWFKNSKYEFKYTEDAVNCASENGHVNVLEWFKNLCKNNKYEFKYTKDAINSASQCEQIHVLEWWKNSGYEFEYDHRSLLHDNDCVTDWYERNENNIPSLRPYTAGFDDDFDY